MRLAHKHFNDMIDISDLMRPRVRIKRMQLIMTLIIYAKRGEN